jgi:Uma2 family endonuclease
MTISEAFPMATSTPVIVPLEEYLSTSYRPDRDWIDGETKERNMGEQLHAIVQVFFAHLFKNHARDWNIRALTEQRVQTSTKRFRIPDVCLVSRNTPIEPILHTPPILCIEILSRDDRMSDIQERVEDYLAMGVPTVWVVDPRRRRAYAALSTGILQPAPTELTVANTEIRVPIADIFAELDELEAQS